MHIHSVISCTHYFNLNKLLSIGNGKYDGKKLYIIATSKRMHNIKRSFI